MLIESLQNKSLFDHCVDEFQVLETHISWVLLTGPYAYKLKKHVNLGFVDFSTLELRKKYCHEELRLNRRLAPELYLKVIPITGNASNPQFDGTGEVFDYAIQMVQFPQEKLLSHAIEQGSLTTDHIDLLAQEVAEFHASIECSSDNTEWGTPANVMAPVEDNFKPLKKLFSSDTSVLKRVELIQSENEKWYQAQQALLAQRKSGGFIRNCHGDMHLGNMILSDKGVTIFDCLEFNAELRWVDVMSEIAFVVMDLEDRGRTDYAIRFLNHYLEITGDYNGIPLLRFYLSYRAMVRAKVTALLLSQQHASKMEAVPLYDEFQSYLELAKNQILKTEPRLILTHGVSGSGKSYGSGLLLEGIPAIRLRSDVERKRIQAECRLSESELYTHSTTELTYQRLADLTLIILTAGWNVIVDATTLKKWQRTLFQELAERLEIPFLLLNFTADREVLETRILKRQTSNIDPSDATTKVLAHQLEEVEDLSEVEQAAAVSIPADQEWTTEMLIRMISNVQPDPIQ